MALIDDVKQICDRLAPLGWRALLRAVTGNELDISQPTPAALRAMLVKNLAAVDRRVPGFEDFAPAGRRAVTAGEPALSLLYHALASPLVTRGASGTLLRGFPTPAELDVVENFIFGLAGLSLNAFVQKHGRDKVAVAVFCSEYRPAGDTVDGRQADLTFARTGIARVGTARPRYEAAARGFWVEDQDNPRGIRVIPARFSAWLAVKKKGRDTRVFPILDNDQAQASGEAQRDFWVPVHKLFAGPECLQGLTLTPRLDTKLFNLKIQRIHRELKTTPLPTGYPYVLRDKEIADWASDPDWGPGWLVPTVHRSLVEPATVDGQFVTFRVTPSRVDEFAAVVLPSKGDFQNMEINAAPSYVHARMKVQNGRVTDLNDEKDPVKAMKSTAYEALHYVDFTGEGWVEAVIPEIPSRTLPRRTAYVLVSAPDFFPSSGQFETSEWSRSPELPEPFRNQLWSVTPTPLSETRLPANLQLPGAPFAAGDVTITAVVSMGAPSGQPAIWPGQVDAVRASTLPDDAAGVFAPGWDVAVDRLAKKPRTPHLSGYGLGSPFPEDAKLCAALSTFWPAVAPDIFRTFATPIGNTSGTIAPLTDAEIGQSGTLPWDGIPGPRVVPEGGQRFVEMPSFIHADYVRQAEQNRFSIRLTSRITVEEYQARILAVSRVYSVIARLGPIERVRDDWVVLSFRAVPAGDDGLQEAEGQAGAVLRGQVYRLELCANVPPSRRKQVESNVRLVRFPLQDLRTFYASAESILVLVKRETDAEWAATPSER
jgi:hypothetical protein